MKTILVKSISAALLGALCLSGNLSMAQENVVLVEDDAVSAVTAEQAQADPANWRQVDPENMIVFETTKGRVIIETFPEIAPGHVAQFTTIARSGDYDGTAFHRVIDGFMAQGGDIFALHVRDSGLPNLQAEFTFRRDPAQMAFDMIGDEMISADGYYKGLPIRTQSSWLADLSADGLVESHIPHCKGVVSTARLGNDENSGNSQFFLMRDRSDHLNKVYSPWGRIVSGQEAPDTMKLGDPQVVNPDILTKAYVVADLPSDERPEVWVQRTDGPVFKAKLVELPDTNVCDLPAVPSIVVG